MLLSVTMKNQHVPLGWGKDPLTQYLDNTRENQYAVFVHKRSKVDHLILIEIMCRQFWDGVSDPSPFAPMLFLHRANAAYLSAVSAIMSGQANEMWTLLRLCIEQSAYAHFVSGDECRYKEWFDRDTSKTKRDKVRKLFSTANISRHLKAHDPKVGQVFDRLYDESITFGAHPNPAGAMLNIKALEVDEGGVTFSTSVLQGDGLALDLGLRKAAQIGIFMLDIAHMIYPYLADENEQKAKLDALKSIY